MFMEDQAEMKTCSQCNSFFPIISQEDAEYGICAENEAFGPYLEHISNQDFTECQELIDEKQFNGQDHVCDQFSPIELTEYEDEDVKKRLEELGANGHLTPGNIQAVIMQEKLRKSSTDVYEDQLNSEQPDDRKEAIKTLCELALFKNDAAFNSLIDYFTQNPPEISQLLQERILFLKHIGYSEHRDTLIQFLLNELRNITSEKFYRQWVLSILNNLSLGPKESIYNPLSEILNEGLFNRKINKKIERTLAELE